MTKFSGTDIFAAFLLKLAGQTIHSFHSNFAHQPRPNYLGQQANDYLRHRLQTHTGGLMISKFGTYELKAFLSFYSHEKGLRKADIPHLLRYQYVLFRNRRHAMLHLSDNAGFFPNDLSHGTRYAQLVAEDWRQIDVLGSYQKEETYPLSLGTNPSIVRVDLNGFYAPFLWKNPWSSALKNKRVLVVHPFTDSIRHQYEHREELFRNPDTLPQFKELLTLKAVQSIAGTPVSFPDWFQALKWMKQEMDNLEYDIALIGCGAYGMHLAAHAKRQGKVAIHLAGMTQMLFGIYGERWAHDPLFKSFILPSWIRPNSGERPQGAEQIENGCYW